MNSSKSFICPLLFKRSPTSSGRRNKSDPCKKFVRVNHIIFDLDGAILDNHEVMDKALKAVFEKYSLEYTPEWALKLMGMSVQGMWDKVAKDLHITAKWGDMCKDYEKFVEGSMAEAPIRPGLERVMDHLEKYQIPMAAVTSSTTEIMEAKTGHIKKLMSRFCHVICGDNPQATKSKPSGLIYLVCAGHFHGRPDPEACLVFENTPVGVLAAMDACMQVIGIPSPSIPSRSLRHADEVLANLNDFWPGKYGLPPFPEQVALNEDPFK